MWTFYKKVYPILIHTKNAEKYYPNAKIVEEVYQSTKFNVTSNPHDYIVFEQEEVIFSIWENDGEFWGENYISSKYIQYVKHNIIESFLKPKDIKAKYDVYFTGENLPTSSLSEYKEGIGIHIAPEYIFGKESPKN